VTTDISICDKEPVRTIGTIQSHGMFFAAEPTKLVVTHASANIVEFGTPEEVIGKPLSAVLGDRMVTAAKRVVDGSHAVECIEFVNPDGQSRSSCIIRLMPGFLMLEFEPAVGDSTVPNKQMVQNASQEIRAAATQQAMLQTLVASTRIITGYDRVMVYRFDEDWNGEVIVEQRKETMSSWLYHRYPASDIPAPARELFTKNPSRIIPQVAFTPVDILPLCDPNSADALDLTYSILRAPSTIHVEYLRNMKVGGSFTMSLLCNGRLWGMIVCHHQSKLYLDFETRTACEKLAYEASKRLSEWETEKLFDINQQLELTLKWLTDDTAGGGEVADVVIERSNVLMELICATGVALIRDDLIVRRGVCPTDDVIRNLLRQIEGQLDPIFAAGCLFKTLQEAPLPTDFSGMMCVRMCGKTGDQFFMWFRPELIEDVIWGGDPDKNICAADGRIHPRKSFAAYKQTMRNTSKPWSRVDMKIATDLARAVEQIMSLS
jgi:two-component system, chemotaxis family, sensor kinase Cph1